ncbi:MAG TPA: hypothetical protein VN857_11520 [Chthoniobacterales bacterium]|nr:hypothetical protein [Chthoniobacterales bacterium]
MLVNFLTLVTEFAAISLATQQMGINPGYSVPIAAVLLVIPVTSGSYKRWERITCILCLLDITWFVMAFFSHPSTSSVLRLVELMSLFHRLIMHGFMVSNCSTNNNSGFYHARWMVSV